MKKLLYLAAVLNVSFGFSMLPSYYSRPENIKKKFITSEITNESDLEKGYEKYEEGMGYQQQGKIASAILAYKEAFFGNSSENEESYLNNFKNHIFKSEPYGECVADAIKKSRASYAASSIATLCMEQGEFLEAAFWYAVSYANGNSSASNSLEAAITHYNNAQN